MLSSYWSRGDVNGGARDCAKWVENVENQQSKFSIVIRSERSERGSVERHSGDQSDIGSSLGIVPFLAKWT